ncbi:MAG: glycosyltransferase family 4 protein [Armatimonadetes bacterium]|nr:glycosyltransferase family 4 protein [Armatimonadota bacterium]
MKILFLSHAQYITVALPKIIESAESLVSMGHEVTIVVTHKKNRFRSKSFEKNGVNYILSPSILSGKLRHGADFYDALRRIFLIRKLKFDIIYAIDSRPSVILPALFLQKFSKIPLILEWSDWFGKGGIILERSGPLYAKTLGIIESYFETAFRLKADGATVISNKLYERLVNMGFSEDKIHIHRMGCNVEKFSNFSKQTSRQYLKIPEDEVIFSYFGRIYPADQKFLLTAFKMFKENTSLKVQVYFIGNVKHTNPPIPSYIKYHGVVSNEIFNHYLSATDICLLPLKINLSNQSRWPSKFIDYLAVGKPIVATAVSDFKEIYDSANFGILCEKDSEEDFAQAMLRMLDLRDKWEDFGKNGLKYVKQNLDWKVINKKLITFFNQIKFGDC